MLDYFQYAFFNRALIAVVLISIICAIIGTYIVARRLVSICGGITHACFGGLGLGYFLGLNPLLMAGVFALASSAAVEWLSRHFRLREDSVVAVLWALGMAIGVLFVFLTPGYVPELNAFLFGNILTVTASDLISFAVFCVITIVFTIWQYRRIVAIAFDRDFATVIGLPVRFISYIMTALMAVCIVLTIRAMGVMLLMSVLSLPIITAEIWCRRFGTIMVAAATISIVCCIIGLLLSTIINVPCSALIVLTMIAAYIVARLTKLTTHQQS